MEQTYAQLVDYLSQSQNRNHEDGVETIIKPIPDSDVSGDLDPRVLGVIKDYAAAEPETTFDLASARASMGWPNRDVTTTDISTDHVTIPSPDGDIDHDDVWRRQRSLDGRTL